MTPSASPASWGPLPVPNSAARASGQGKAACHQQPLGPALQLGTNTLELPWAWGLQCPASLVPLWHLWPALLPNRVGLTLYGIGVTSGAGENVEC